MPVFLLDVYAKGEKIDLTQDEKNTPDSPEFSGEALRLSSDP